MMTKVITTNLFPNVHLSHKMTIRLNNRNLSILSGFLCLIFLISFSGRASSLQIAGEWTPLRQINGYLDDTFPPYMIADHNRTVHAFVSQWVGEYQLKKAVFYRQWTAVGGWTNPVDILLPEGSETKVYGAYLDQKGIIHLLYQVSSEGDSSIYYSRAPIVDAARATSWSTPKLVGEGALVPGSGAIIGDANGNLAIIYNGNLKGNGVYAVHSSDGGQSWSESAPIYLTYVATLIPFSLQIIQGQDGQAHAVWNVVNNRGVDISIYYAQLTFDDNQWNAPVLLDEKIEKPDYFGPSFPAIVDNGQEIVIMYNSGNPNENGEVNEGRPVQRVRRSNDGGKTWSEVVSPFIRHVGRSGSHALVLDSDGIAHALFIQRVESTNNELYAPIGGLWHSEYRNGRWAEPELIDLGTMSGHDIHAVVSQGNTLLVTMREDPGVSNEGVWYTTTALNAPEMPIITPELILPTPINTATPTPTAISITPTPPFNPSGKINQEQLPPVISNNPVRPILLGLLPVILLFGAYILLQLTHYRR